ncbi:TPA: hypothetical protein MJB77_25460 [Klebsiella pneumoniae]|uniref:hypothetical protein n=1 Tax=Raoultella ornithinolytica TaxID=54291 RepID=UPI001131C43B|nr:hypothetical protein [Raoultella ornithinolytica]MTF08769.1 hypothetical protein [Raoultella ornithinolytica]HBZ0630568.1 hypothetical protein [Klebsiella pneumoniae]HCI4298632.1 hypothetical protein [Klebsiella pneumoniae]HCI8981217.1 hypothetical protein [Klebsiella pneumoniae]
MKKCLVDGCERDAGATAHGKNGYCSAHYQRIRIHGDAMTYKKIAKPFKFKKCLVEDCERSANRINGGKRGYCSMHYLRVKRSGDPLVVKQPPSPAKDFIETFKDYGSDECLIWPFHRDKKDGYGRIHESGTEKLLTASRAMCIAAHGEPPTERHESAHTCGKGHEGCVNPRHLYWATPEENQGDRVLHGTSNRGEAQWNHKLTVEQVREIRLLLDSHTLRELADLYSVSTRAIHSIKTHKTWAWLD